MAHPLKEGFSSTDPDCSPEANPDRFRSVLFGGLPVLTKTQKIAAKLLQVIGAAAELMLILRQRP
jgi:hypothetical protein